MCIRDSYTTFWEYIRAGDPVGVNILRDGVPILDCHYGTSNGRYSLKIDRLITSSTLSWLGDSRNG